jgi:ornithine cyclodeaminase
MSSERDPAGPLGVPLIGPEQIVGLLRPRDAVAAIQTALRGGLDPAGDPARSIVSATHGQLLIMPSEVGEFAGVKIVTIAPDNPAQGRPRIQGLYLLFDAATLAPVAVLDGIALTTLRTPAVSLAAVRPFLTGDRLLTGQLPLTGVRPVRAVVFGSGPQAVGHVATLIDTLDGVRPVTEVTYLVRRPGDVTVPPAGDVTVTVEDVAGAAASAALAAADVVVCATTARRPLFDSALLPERAVVIVVGSHEPDAREVDGALVGRAHVLVEDVGTATREAGDIVQAIAEGRLRTADLIPIASLFTGAADPRPDRPVLFKSTGMAWEDLVIAGAVHRRWSTARSAG